MLHAHSNSVVVLTPLAPSLRGLLWYQPCLLHASSQSVTREPPPLAFLHIIYAFYHMEFHFLQFPAMVCVALLLPQPLTETWLTACASAYSTIWTSFRPVLLYRRYVSCPFLVRYCQQVNFHFNTVLLHNRVFMIWKLQLRACCVLSDFCSLLWIFSFVILQDVSPHQSFQRDDHPQVGHASQS